MLSTFTPISNRVPTHTQKSARSTVFCLLLGLIILNTPTTSFAWFTGNEVPYDPTQRRSVNNTRQMTILIYEDGTQTTMTDHEWSTIRILEDERMRWFESNPSSLTFSQLTPYQKIEKIESALMKRMRTPKHWPIDGQSANEVALSFLPQFTDHQRHLMMANVLVNYIHQAQSFEPDSSPLVDAFHEFFGTDVSGQKWALCEIMRTPHFMRQFNKNDGSMTEGEVKSVEPYIDFVKTLIHKKVQCIQPA